MFLLAIFGAICVLGLVGWIGYCAGYEKGVTVGKKEQKEAVAPVPKQGGFTLIELIIVLVIIALVVKFVWPWFARFVGIHVE